MSEANEKEVKAEKPAKAEPVKAEKPAPVIEKTDGLVAFTKDGVTIRRNAEQTNALEKLGWEKVK